MNQAAIQAIYQDANMQVKEIAIRANCQAIVDGSPYPDAYVIGSLTEKIKTLLVNLELEKAKVKELEERLAMTTCTCPVCHRPFAVPDGEWGQHPCPRGCSQVAEQCIDCREEYFPDDDRSPYCAECSTKRVEQENAEYERELAGKES